MQKKLKNVITLSFLLLLSLVFGQKVAAQNCSISTNFPLNRGCINQTITLVANGGPPGASNWLWDYGDGNNGVSLTNQQVWKYTAPGAYRPRVTIKAIGQPDCVVYGDTVYINPLPNANIIATNGYVHCWEGNSVCFEDQSSAATPIPGQPKANLFKRIVLFGDGDLINTAPTPANKNFCHSYLDPVDRIYTVTIRVTDLNNCVDTTRIKVRIIGSLGLKGFATSCDSLGNPQPIGCAQNPVSFCTWYCFTNNSDIFYDPVIPDSVMKFRWEFGDGDFDTVNWAPKHKYCKGGVFQPKLYVWDVNGCPDTLLTNTVRNVSFKFDITPSAKSQCASGAKVTWNQTPIPGAQFTWRFFVSSNPPLDPATNTYQYNWLPISPDPKIFMEEATFTPTRDVPCGATRVSLSVRIPGCADTVFEWDTIEAVGPTATIEVPSTPLAIPDTERFQCKIVNPIHFRDLSCRYRAFNVERLWDFGDRYARQCTTDTKKGINVFGADTLSLLDPIKYPPGPTRPCNCNFSKDTLPVHVYTDWDTLALRQVNGLPAPGTMLNPTQKPYVDKSFACFTVRLLLWDTVNKCRDSTTLNLPLGPPKAGPIDAAWANGDGTERVATPYQAYTDQTSLQANGLQCFGNAPNGILFQLNKLVPNCTRGFVAINYDSAANPVGKNFVNQPGHFQRLNSQGPWAIPPPPKAWPNVIAKNYFDPPGLADTNGWVTIGLVVGNGYTSGNGSSHWCYDTVWYHRMLRFVPSNANFSVNQVHNCVPMTLVTTPQDTAQDSVLAVIWNWGDGESTVDSILRKPTYKRTRYQFDENGLVTSQSSVSFLADTLVNGATHIYKKSGRFYPSLSILQTTGCLNFGVREIVAGFHNEMEVSDTVVCIGDEVNFRDSAYYWRYPEPVFPPKEVYYLGRDTIGLDGTRTQPPLPPYQYERIFWDFNYDSAGTGMTHDHVGPWPKKRYKFPGIYTVKMVTMDSMKCTDTVTARITVVGQKSVINVPKAVFACEDTVKLFDASYVIDPYFQKYGIKSDSLASWYWEFGDGKTPSILQNPVHEYTSNGDFTVTLVTRNFSGCADTTTALVKIDGPIPLFDFVGDSVGCAPFKVEMDNKSIKAQSYIWYFGNPNDPFNTFSTDGDTNMTKLYKDPGYYCITLLAKDRPSAQPNICPLRIYPDTLSPLVDKRCVKVLRTPEAKIKSKIVVCKGDLVWFKNESDTIYSNLSWDFDDGTAPLVTAKVDSVSHTFNKAGIFTVKLSPSYVPVPGDIMCPDSATWTIIVDSVVADFDVDTPNTSAPKFAFKNKSTGGVAFNWSFGHPEVGQNVIGCTDVNPIEIQALQLNKVFADEIRHCYGNDTGEFEVCLWAFSASGCVDSICKKVKNTFTKSILIPNVFTPGNDTINNVLDIPIDGWEKYEVIIFNRWGNKVFESKDPSIDWNGKVFNSGEECPSGTYYMQVYWRLRGENNDNRNVVVTLIRP